jgi:two-component system heavy metal sensor histidine kinase CusS
VSGARFGGYSITTRLALLFALALAALSLGAGGYLYHALTVDLTQRDDNELHGKAALAVEELSRIDSLAPINARDSALAHIVVGHDRLTLYVVGADDRVLFATRTPRVPPGARTALLESAQARLVANDGHSVRAFGRQARLRTGESVAVFVESDTTETDRLLAGHLREIVLAVLLSAMLGLGAAYGIARSGLGPLRAMADTAKRISAEQLGERLCVEGAPVELRELAAAFNAMLDRLQESFTRLNEFSSDLAHEMRTPLSNLIGQTQVMLSRGRSADEYRAALESNTEEFERLSRMVGDMLFLARADNPQTRVARRPVDLRAVALKMQQFYEPILADRNVSLSIDGDGRIEADPLMIERAVSNLVSNAVRHAEPSSEIRIRIDDRPPATTLQVSNRGRPIPAEVRDRLFSRFARADTDGRDGEGIGLGLAIVQSIMKLHSGTVTVDGSVEGETRFVLSFPAAAANLPAMT